MERIEKQPFIREEMRIPDVTDMDGLVSLMGRSMDNEESFHIDLLLASLSRMQSRRMWNVWFRFSKWPVPLWREEKTG